MASFEIITRRSPRPSELVTPAKEVCVPARMLGGPVLVAGTITWVCECKEEIEVRFADPGMRGWVLDLESGPLVVPGKVKLRHAKCYPKIFGDKKVFVYPVRL